MSRFPILLSFKLKKRVNFKTKLANFYIEMYAWLALRFHLERAHISPVIFVAGPATNCNRTFLFANHLGMVSRLTY